MPDIYYLSEDDINNPGVVEYIQTAHTSHFYWSDSWNPGFYSRLAYEGLISTTYRKDDGTVVLLPEMQREYAVLDWDNLHISGHVRKLLRSPEQYSLRINHNLSHLLQNIMQAHADCWLTENYIILLENLSSPKEDVACRILSVELYDSCNNLAAGEVGYKIGNIYTSLSGFVKREKPYDNWGSLQMVLLGRYLESEGYDFWNLGHPYMEYKIRMGGKVLSRKDFLSRWKRGRNCKMPGLEKMGFPFTGGKPG